MSLLGNVAELAILLKLKDEVTGPLKNVERSLTGLHAQTGTVAGGMSKIGAGLATAAVRMAEIGATAAVGVAGIAISATKAAGDFQAAMVQIETQAGASAAEVKSASTAILAMSGTVGTSADVLAAGLYHIESAGIRGAKALDVLKLAAEGAKVGNSDLESTTNALIAEVNSGVGGITSMGQAMGVLNGIVGSGNMRMQDLVDALGTGLLTKAKTFGVSIQSVGAALADMTNQGVPAVQAATEIGSAFRLMAAPTSKATKELASIGLGQLDLANSMRGPTGIVGAVQLLGAHMKKAGLLDASGNPTAAGADLLTKAFGGKQSTAILALVGNLQQLPVILDKINTSSGSFNDAWTTASQDVAFKTQAVQASLNSLKITLGQQLLPVAANVLGALSKGLADPAVTQGVTDFGKALAGMFSPENLAQAGKFVHEIIPQIGDFAHSVLPPLIEGLKIAGQVTSSVVGLFMSLPQPLQAAIIAGLTVNKLSGGLVGSGLKDIAQGLLSGKAGGGVGGGVTSMLGIQKVFVVNMPPGGVGGGLGGAAGALEGAAGTAGGVGAVAIGAAVLAIPVAIAAANIIKTISGTTDAQQQYQQTHGQFGPRGAANVATIDSRDMDKLRNSAIGAGRDMDKLVGKVTDIPASVKAAIASLREPIDRLSARQQALQVTVNVNTTVSVRQNNIASQSFARYSGKMGLQAT